MEDILKNKKSLKNVEKGVLISLIYPYYLAKFGFDLQNSKNICVGPYSIRGKKKKKEIKIDSNYNEAAMLSLLLRRVVIKSKKNQKRKSKRETRKQETRKRRRV